MEVLSFGLYPKTSNILNGHLKICVLSGFVPLENGVIFKFRHFFSSSKQMVTWIVVIDRSLIYNVRVKENTNIDGWQSQEFIFGGAIYKIFCVCMKSKIVMYNTS